MSQFALERFKLCFVKVGHLDMELIEKSCSAGRIGLPAGSHPWTATWVTGLVYHGFWTSQGTIPTISRLVLERARFFLEKLMILVGPVGKSGDLVICWFQR